MHNGSSTIVPLGPIYSYAWVTGKIGDEMDASIELWVLSGFKRFLEISVKTKVKNAREVQRRLKEGWSRLGLKESSDPTTKTTFALEYFAK